MSTRTRTRLTIAACVLSSAITVAGCSHKQSNAAGGSSKETPSQVQQAVKEQAAKRAAYFNSHPGPGR